MRLFLPDNFGKGRNLHEKAFYRFYGGMRESREWRRRESEGRGGRGKSEGKEGKGWRERIRKGK